MANNVDDLLRSTAARQPEHPAILGPQEGALLTYSELDAAIGSATQALFAAGVRKGHTVGLHCRSGAEYIIQNYAIWRAEACVVPIAPELAPDEKEEICRSIALDFVVSSPEPPKFLADMSEGGPVSLAKPLSITKVKSPVEHPDGFERLNAAFIRFTSGTTGQSKGVVLSHESIEARIRAANEALKLGPEDKVMWLLSMSYHFTVSIVGYLTFGASIVLPENALAAAVVRASEKHGATLLYGSPMHCALMADYAPGKHLPSLRVAISTTTSLDPDVSARFLARYGTPISQALGLIEIGLPCINLEFAGKKQDSVGKVLPAYRVRLDDVGFGPEFKEIFFAGPGLLDAYYRPFRTRDEIMPGGWFATHDVGYLDEDGCLFLRGRSKEVISVMGMKFFPHEVEAVLAQHEAVKEAAVYAARHERTGEAVRARVVLAVPEQAGLEQELRQHCLQKLASYKVPEKIEFVAALPRTASGKVLHRTLR